MPRTGKQTLTAAPYVPATTDLETLRAAAQNCKGCDLYKEATQAVFGEGNSRAQIMLVGEQPGNAEDKQGQPFVGPAGGLLARALQKAGLERSEVYITNAVKHFRFFVTKHYRFHRNPSGLQIHACRPWLEAEIGIVKPEVIVALGATAARSILQKPVTLKSVRGTMVSLSGIHIVFTIHPSALLRMEEGREEQFKRFVADLKMARELISVRELDRAA